MKLTYPSASVCQLQIQPWGGRLAGVLFVLIGLGIGSLYFSTTKINCAIKKPGVAQQCLFKESVAGIYHSSDSIGQLEGSKINSIYNPPNGSNQQGSYSYQVLLLTQAVPTGLAFNMLNSSSLNDAQSISQDINNYISNSSENKLLLPSAYPLWILLFPLIFIPVGIMLFYTSSKTNLLLDKEQQMMTLSRISYAGTNEMRLEFTKLSHFFVNSRMSPSTNNNNNNNGFQWGTNNNQQQVYGIVLELADHTQIEITPTYDNAYNKKVSITEQLNTWIKPNNL